MVEDHDAIYFDYHATTPVDPRVASVVMQYMTRTFGNASSTDHVFGDVAEAAVNEARNHAAALVGAAPESVIFTSGATESLNLAIQGFCRAMREREIRRPVQLGLMPVEHAAVLDTCEALAADGLADLHFFEVDRRAQLDLDAYETKCRETRLDLVCVMAANNEVGTIYPIAQAAAVAHEHGAVFLTDATQAAGKINIDFTNWNLDFLAFSAHKIYGPKGVGALLIAPGMHITPLVHGGGHERGLRSGTLNVPGIVGFGEACRLRKKEMSIDEPRIKMHRDRLQHELRQRVTDLHVNGDQAHRLAGCLHVSIPSVPNAAIISRLRNALAMSTGSACRSGIEAPSHVLRAMRLPDNHLNGALRFGMGKFTSDTDVSVAAERIAGAVTDTRRLMSVR